MADIGGEAPPTHTIPVSDVILLIAVWTILATELVASLLVGASVSYFMFLAVPNVLLVASGSIIVARSEQRSIGWILIYLGLIFAYSIGIGLPVETHNLLLRVFDGMSTGSASLFAYLILIFPSGAPPNQLGRWVKWPTLLYAVVTIGSGVWVAITSPAIPIEEIGVSFLDWVFLLIAVLVIISQVTAYRRRPNVEKLQIKWLLLAGIVALVSYPFAIALWGDNPAVFLPVDSVLTSLWPVAILIAITRYRLYDIDVVISRTLVYGLLALFIGAVYVGIAVLPWIILGNEARNNTWLGIAATIVVAVSFQPLRRRLERLSNRVVYGRRATPYEVLSAFSQGISAVDPDVLGQVAKSLAEGTTADAASIWVGADDSLHCIAAWPALPARLDQSSVSSPVVYNDEELGRVVLEIAPGQPFPETDRRLLDQVASGLGLALRNLQLTEDLRDRVDDLAASRRRIVTVQDETRRKLERDLHDGAQQRLVALKIKLGIGSAMAERAGLDEVKAMVDIVREETDHTIDSVRDFARGIYPPLLEAEGLGQALNAQARKMPIPVTVQAAGLGRYAKGQEATVYFCVLEALQNAMKHSEASSVRVVLTDRDGEVAFEVRDDGIGFDKTSVDPNGLLNMKDRVEAVGGEFTVDTQPGRGTRVSGNLPVSEMVAV